MQSKRIDDNPTHVMPSKGVDTNQLVVDFIPIRLEPGGERILISISRDNIHIVWPVNETGNDEVLFRASIDRGITFANKITLSNSTDSESQDVVIMVQLSNHC
jgi:hypothetical protein